MKLIKYIFAGLIAIALLSCVGYKVKTFYVGEGNQYFFSPMKFESEANYLLVDITCRYTKTNKEQPIFNYTVFFDGDIQKPSSAAIHANNTTCEIKNIKKIYHKIESNEIRYTGNIDRDCLLNFFTDKETFIKLIIGGKEEIFKASDNFEEASEYFKKQIIPYL